MKDLSKHTSEKDMKKDDVILSTEWNRFRVHQQRMRWAELGEQMGLHLDLFIAQQEAAKQAAGQETLA